MNTYCDIYLFCLWHRARKYWKYIVGELSKEYELTMSFISFFPNEIKTLRKFYNNERLVGGYEEKLKDVSGEFLVCIYKDSEMNNFKKLYDIKKKLRALSGRKEDYNFLHSSNTTKEFCNQIEIIGGFQWRSETFT